MALLAIEPGKKALTKAELMTAQRVGPESNDWYVVADGVKMRLKTFPAITNEHYRLYHEV